VGSNPAVPTGETGDTGHEHPDRRRPVVDGTDAALVATTTRVLTVPNVLSALRLLGVPLFLWLLLGPEADGAALAVLMVSGWTDYFDGKIARRYGLISPLGQVLDPLADRLYVLSTLGAFLLRDVIPLWLVVVLLARDLVLAAALPVLRRHGYGPLAVSFLGKAATFNLLYSFPLLLLAAGDNPLVTIARPLGWAFVIWGSSLYWWSAGLYLVQARRLVREDVGG
jgi:CDP-diacylglycerol--glycerol-3-phosphate 3-phosphatidyltransferase